MKIYKWPHTYATTIFRKTDTEPTFSLPVGLRGIISEPVTLEVLSSNVFCLKEVVSNGVIISNVIWFNNFFHHQSDVFTTH